MSYTGAADPGPCEGRQASPSNPNRAGAQRTETFVFRCTASEKAALRAKAEAARVPIATLLREAMGAAQPRRRKPVPRVDPALVLALARIGGNLNQIARRVNAAALAGALSPHEAMAVAGALVSIDRQLASLLAEARRC